MRKLAYNEIRYKGKEYRQAIAEYGDDGELLCVREFREEEPFTEWIGGRVDL